MNVVFFVRFKWKILNRVYLFLLLNILIRYKVVFNLFLKVKKNQNSKKQKQTATGVIELVHMQKLITFLLRTGI